jgi:thiamine biosynthesis lipoprotein
VPAVAGFAAGDHATGLHRFAHEAMATVFEIWCAHDDAGYARQAAQEAFQLVDRLEQELSRFVANSDVSRVNALLAGQAARVSPATFECLEIARALHELTGGAFDVSLGTGLERFELVPEDFSVRAESAGARLDLGGIGKGYAVDRAADLLREWGIDRALVHGGSSSVLASEPPRGHEGWSLTLRTPWPGAPPATRIQARQTALSASGTGKGDHIVDPRSGRPVRGRAAFVALPVPAPSPGLGGPDPEAPLSPASVAEGLSTACMVLAEDAIRELSRGWPGVEVWIASEPSAGEAVPGLVRVAGPGAPIG